ncbi:unnamed protein product [Prorocentrum cordatum]|uniref:Uncharacterized protein n=1 Tax=Prorocentrum cordatum TaxID=2364126 RepID=A0ABN9R010_9DINO|nr:unnamed protein product [Polarella glacialis]
MGGRRAPRPAQIGHSANTTLQTKISFEHSVGGQSLHRSRTAEMWQLQGCVGPSRSFCHDVLQHPMFGMDIVIATHNTQTLLVGCVGRAPCSMQIWVNVVRWYRSRMLCRVLWAACCRESSQPDFTVGGIGESTILQSSASTVTSPAFFEDPVEDPLGEEVIKKGG